MDNSTLGTEDLAPRLLAPSTIYRNSTISLALDLHHNDSPLSSGRIRILMTEDLKSVEHSIMTKASQQLSIAPQRISLSVCWRDDLPPNVQVVSKSQGGISRSLTAVDAQNLKSVLELMKQRGSKDVLVVHLEDATKGPLAPEKTAPKSRIHRGPRPIEMLDQNHPAQQMARMFAVKREPNTRDGILNADLMKDGRERGESPQRRQKLVSEDAKRSMSRRETYDNGTWEGVGRFQRRESQHIASRNATRKPGTSSAPIGYERNATDGGRYPSESGDTSARKAPPYDEDGDAKARGRTRR